MATIWVRKRGDAEHSEIKLTLDRFGHISDVLTQSAEVLWFGGQKVSAGALQAETPEGRPLSNKEPVGAHDGRSLIVSERNPSQYSSSPHLTHQVPPHARSNSGQGHYHSEASTFKTIGDAGRNEQIPTGKHVCAGCGKQILGLKVVLTLPGSPTSVDLHPECEVQFERANALSCTYCADLILDRLTTLTGDFGTINLHPQCVDPYKRTAGPGVGIVPAGSVAIASGGGFSTVNGQSSHIHSGQFSAIGGSGGVQNIAPGVHTCSLCRNGIEGTKVSLKLPGFNHKVDLHPQCEYTYAVNNALRCDHCTQPMLDGITVLTGNFGEARSKQLHPSCVTAFKQAQSGHGKSAINWHQETPYMPANTQWKPIAGAPAASYGGGVRWAPQ